MTVPSKISPHLFLNDTLNEKDLTKSGLCIAAMGGTATDGRSAALSSSRTVPEPGGLRLSDVVAAGVAVAQPLDRSPPDNPLSTAYGVAFQPAPRDVAPGGYPRREASLSRPHSTARAPLAGGLEATRCARCRGVRRTPPLAPGSRPHLRTSPRFRRGAAQLTRSVGYRVRSYDPTRSPSGRLLNLHLPPHSADAAAHR